MSALLFWIWLLTSLSHPPHPVVAKAVEPAEKPRLVVVTLADGQQLCGRIVRRGSDSRLWLRMEGTSTVLHRPLPNDGVTRIKTLVPRPAPAASNRPRGVSDAELAHQLLFGEPED